jgi:DNA repair protein RadA/Sms
MAKQKIKTVYSCQKCGAQRPKWQGQCSDCGAWNSYVEEIFSNTSNSSNQGWAIGASSAQSSGSRLNSDVMSLEGNLSSSGANDDAQGSKSKSTVTLADAVTAPSVSRQKTGFSELDRVLGGGAVKGSYTLLGGDPGIGKSTLLIQMAGGLGQNGEKVLYVSAEESVGQTHLRATRLGLKSNQVHVASENNLEHIIALARKIRPSVLIVDSIQTVFLPTIQSAPGSVSQVRECAGHLMVLAKNEGISIFLIGHVTKDGNIAGPKTLEHMVDTVLSFEGDANYQFRILRTQKNRFGAANEIAVFEMDGKGLREVLNPSELFLSERGQKSIGSAVFASMEGSRPILCEIQALVVSSQLAMPRRTCLGWDANRLHILTAVLDKNLDLNLATKDVFVNVVGGFKVSETGADTAVAAAMLSSLQNEALKQDVCFLGEIGLTGEVRGISFAESRVKEAAKLGYNKFILPQGNKRHLKNLLEEGNSSSFDSKDFLWINNVKELYNSLGISSNKTSKQTTYRSTLQKSAQSEIRSTEKDY